MASQGLDLKLAQTKFAFNWASSATIGHSPVKVGYGINLFIPIELTFLPIDLQVYRDTQEKMKAMKNSHESIKGLTR